MANKAGKILIIFGCCCVIAAAAFYTYNQQVSARAASAAEELTEALSSLIEASETAAQDEGTDPLLGDPGVEETPVPDGTDEQLVTVSVKDYDIAGVVSIPVIGIELAVISEWSYPNLKISACRYSGTPSGQLVLLAHNYKRHFGRIGELQPGDDVVFTSPDGTVYNYKVTGTEIKGKYELQDILDGDWDLTLFTCTYGGASRVVVRCIRAD